MDSYSSLILDLTKSKVPFENVAATSTKAAIGLDFPILANWAKVADKCYLFKA